MSTNSPWHHLYNTKDWKALRLAQLRAEPTCRYCRALGKVEAANTVDHKKPHKGNRALFLDPANLQSLCKPCHDSAKQTLERTGVLPGCGPDGLPLDANHHWNR